MTVNLTPIKSAVFHDCVNHNLHFSTKDNLTWSEDILILLRKNVNSCKIDSLKETVINP